MPESLSQPLSLIMNKANYCAQSYAIKWGHPAVLALALGVLLWGLSGCRTGTDSSDKPAPAAVPVQFTDITHQAGLKFTHNNGAFGLKFLPETMGSGVAFIDYDGDGYQDIFLVNSSDWSEADLAHYLTGKWDKNETVFYQGLGLPLHRRIPPHRPLLHSTCALYHNNGNGTFTDVTRGSGLDIEMYGMGVAVGDYDNDGRPDLYVTGYGRNYLFHNAGKGKWQEVAAGAGVKDAGWSTSVAWLDYDKDGRLDLFVCHYLHWTPANDVFGSLDAKHKSYSGPEVYAGEPCRLYHNVGGGKFVDVSKAAGIMKLSGAKVDEAAESKGLAVAICDYNNDSWPDILVANDREPTNLFRNNKNGTFSEVAATVGIALSNNGTARAGMGLDSADIDHTGRESMLVANFNDEMLGLYQNQGDGLFKDVAPMSQVGSASRKSLSFGCAFLDLDNDSWPDILVANGHVRDDIAVSDRHVTYAERPLLFHNEGGLNAGPSAEHQVNFKEVGLQSGAALSRPIVGRGLAAADIDLDGDVDVIFTTNGGPPLLLRNDGGNKNNSLRIELRGTKSNRSGIGAVIEAKVGTATLRRTVRSGSSYLSQSELPITLGLGQASKVESLTVYWPSVATTQLGPLSANQMITVQEGEGIIRQQPFKRR